MQIGKHYMLQQNVHLAQSVQLGSAPAAEIHALFSRRDFTIPTQFKRRDTGAVSLRQCNLPLLLQIKQPHNFQRRFE